MNKKLKKILATVSAVAMCAVSMTSIFANALAVLVNNQNWQSYIEDDIVYCLQIPLDTKSFYCGDAKFVLWEDATEYMKQVETCYPDIIIYKKEGSSGFNFMDTMAYIKSNPYGVIDEETIYVSWDLFPSPIHTSEYNEEDLNTITEYLDSKNIEYSIKPAGRKEELSSIDLKDKDNYFSICLDVLENTGFELVHMAYQESVVSVDSVEIPLPEPTISGDATEDGEVNIADAVLIMQTLSNPDEYKLTPQGMANADMDGDGVTAMDAFKIQEMILNL